jgi:hypothetical protein
MGFSTRGKPAAKSKRQTLIAMWLCGTALWAGMSTPAIAQEATQQLLQSRTQSRQSILSAASPTSVLEAPVAADPTVTATTAPAPASATPVDENAQLLPEGFVQAENSFALPIDVDEMDARLGDDSQTPGIRLGTFVLRPTLSQTINSQHEKQGETTSSRSYLTTSVRGSLESDWSRHALRINGEGRFERNISGTSLEEKPQANIDADLRLDLGGDIEAHVLGGYRSEKEDVTSPNAIDGIASQGTEHRYNLGASIAREFGSIRSTTAVDFARTQYDDAKDFSGASISLSERDRNEAQLRSRLGLELSPALIPFLEVTAATTRYDQKNDSLGYQRSSRTIGAKLGTEFDRGEKLSGEVAVGYLTRSYDDARLSSVSAVSLDAIANWSPQRGTVVNLGLRTSLDDFANGGESGWANYQFRTGLTHQIRSNVIGRLTAQIEHRDTQDVTEYLVGAGVTWGLNRYVDLTADVSYKETPRYDTSDVVIGAGISLKR